MANFVLFNFIMHRLRLIIPLFIISVSLFSQDIGTIIHENTGKSTNLQVAEQLFRFGLFYEAIPFYEAVLAEKSSRYNYPLLFNLAECYRHCRYYAKAYSLYKKLTDYAVTRYPQSLALMAWMEQSMENYEEAIKHYQAFLDYTLDKPTELIPFAQQQLIACKIVQKKINQPSAYKTTILPATVNKQYSNYGLSPTGQRLWLTGTKTTTGNKKIMIESTRGKYHSLFINRIYYTDLKSARWQNRVEATINPDKEYNHVSSPFYDNKDSVLYFTICNNDSTTSCNIYRSNYRKNRLDVPEKLNTHINSAGSSSRHPAICYIHNKRILFFSSDRYGGQGGFDIYYSIAGNNDEFGNAINAGNVINTPENEITPFFDMLHNTLYFSSTGHYGYGNYDIFKSTGNPVSGFSIAQNLPYPINSGADDYFFAAWSQDTNRFFLSSNRYQNKFKNEETCCDKIYSIEKLPVNTFSSLFTGTVTDIATSEPLIALVQIYDTLNHFLDSAQTTTNGKYIIRNIFPHIIITVVSARGYLFNVEKTIINSESNKSHTIIKNFKLQKIEQGATTILRNIYFETDSTALQVQSFPALNQIISFLNSYPTLKIEISGHTDNTGTNDYNNRLSELRAKSVVDYLISNNIDSLRLSYCGYGSSRPVVTNTTAENRGLNRRVEFKIIEF